MIEDYIQITKLNDMLYSPASVYMHSSYEDKDINIYKEKSQIQGSKNHENIDNEKYSTSKHIITNMTVYSERLGLVGKIDIYNSRQKKLIERKTFIKKIHKGYIMQLYAQYYAMEEMGYEINQLYLYSTNDNKMHKIEKPVYETYILLQKLIKKIRGTKPENMLSKPTDKTGRDSIYGGLSW